MNVKGKYLKDETGATFSPITSSNTVYYNNKTINNELNKLKYYGKYAYVYNTSYQYEYTIHSGTNDLNYLLTDIITNTSGIFSISNNKLKLTFPDNNIHHIEVDCFMYGDTRNTDTCRADITTRLQRNNYTNQNDPLNKYYSQAVASFNGQYNITELYFKQNYFAVQNNDLLGIYVNVWMYNVSSEQIWLRGAIKHNNEYTTGQSGLIIKIID